MTIAIIGAGLAGIAAGRALTAAGLDLVLFDKSRGVGGRVATRRADDPAEGGIDHGAPLLHGLPAALIASAGTAARGWRDGVVGLPGNSALARSLATGLDLRLGVRVSGLARCDDGWRLATEAGAAAGPYAAVLVAVPQPQAAALVGADAARFPGFERVQMQPGWTVMARFPAAVPGAGWRADLPPPLGLAVRDAAKPGRAAGEAWAIHADDATASARLEDAPEAVAADLVAAFRAATGAPAPATVVPHRWRYARVARPAGVACFWDEGLGLGLAGDWCLGADAGHAVASGMALAEAVEARCGAWAG